MNLAEIDVRVETMGDGIGGQVDADVLRLWSRPSRLDDVQVTLELRVAIRAAERRDEDIEPTRPFATGKIDELVVA